MLLSSLIVALLLTFLYYACSSKESADSQDTIVSEATAPQFDMSAGMAAVAGGASPGSGGQAAAAAPAGGPGFFSQTIEGGPGAPAPGTISGTVNSDTSSPLGGIAVYLFLADGSPAGINTVTGASGSFTLPLAPGQYKLFFSDPEGTYQPAWYGGYGPGTAALVSVVSSQETSITQTLSMGTDSGSLAGTARDESGAGIAGVNVFAFLFYENGCGDGSCDSLELKGTATTGADGTYEVKGLIAGSYEVMFSPLGTDFSLQWYREQSTHQTAKTVEVTAGKTTAGIDASLYRGGTISGTITRQGGSPAAYALIDVYDETGIIVYSGLTGAAGLYQTAPLPDGSYRVHAATNMPGGWTEEWYNNKADFASAEPVAVTRAGDTNGIDIEIDDPSSSSPGDSGDDDDVIIIFEETGVVATDGRAGGVAAEGEAAQSEPVYGSDGMAAVSQGADQSVLPDKNQQDVVGDRRDDDAVVGQVEGDDTSLT